MKKLNIKGFSAVEGLLIVILVALVAGIGFYVYNQSQKQDSTSQPQTSIPSNASSGQPITEAKDGVLEIKELGVKMILDENTEDAYYKMEDGVASLYTKSLDKKVSSGVPCDIAIIGATKVGEDDYATGNAISTETLEELNSLKIEDEYFYVTRAQSTCAPDDEAVQAYEAEVVESLETAEIQKL